MKILVTGSTGFIGAALCRRLAAAGHQVRAFHRATSSLQGLAGLDVEHWVGDITQPDSIAPAMVDVEVVFHAAAMLGTPSDPGKMYLTTVEGTRTVLDAALQANVRRLVHTSSVAALGVPATGPKQAGQPLLMNENHTWNNPPGPWHYGNSKYLAELEVQKAVARGLDAVIVNPSGVFGAGDVYRVRSSIIMQVAQGRLPVSVAGGWNVVHIEDVIDGHLAALERGQTGQRYILGGQNMTFHTFLNLIAEVTGAKPIRTNLPAWLPRAAARPLHWLRPFLNLPVDGDILRLSGYHFYYDTSKASQELGLTAPRAPRTAIQDAYDWFRTAAQPGSNTVDSVAEDANETENPSPGTESAKPL